MPLPIIYLESHPKNAAVDVNIFGPASQNNTGVFRA
jgi:hypothetical protein